MKLPSMKYADRITKGKQVKFGGLNHTMGAGDGEIWDMRNMTGDYFPLLVSRKPRYLYKTLDNPGGLYCHGKLCWVSGGGFYYDGQRKGDVAPGLKLFASINNYVIILPDKSYYNVQTDTFGSLEAKWGGASLTFGDGKLYGEAAYANMIRCEGVDWGLLFREGDAVAISGCTAHPENNKTPIIRQIDGDKMYFYEYVFTLENETEYTEEGNLKIERLMPDVKFLCENENRLWGCDDSTIYATKLGDPFSWYVYDGLDSDAFFVTPGSPGGFVGGADYRSFAILFKEDRIYKVYGSSPTSFKAVDSASMGLEESSSGSIAVAGETMFYLSRNGVVAYTGGIPQLIGEELGAERFHNACAGTDGLKYYVSMEGEESGWGLYVYDTRTGLWHREDDLQVTHFARWEGNLYALCDNGEIWILGDASGIPEGAVREESVNWMVEFADFTEGEANKKEAGKLQMRIELEKFARAEVWIQFDSDGQWQKVSTIIGEGPKRSYYLPIVPRRCDHYRVRLTGEGGCRIYSMSREYSVSTALKSKPGRN